VTHAKVRGCVRAFDSASSQHGPSRTTRAAFGQEVAICSHPRRLRQQGRYGDVGVGGQPAGCLARRQLGPPSAGLTTDSSLDAAQRTPSSHHACPQCPAVALPVAPRHVHTGGRAPACLARCMPPSTPPGPSANPASEVSSLEDSRRRRAGWPALQQTLPCQRTTYGRRGAVRADVTGQGGLPSDGVSVRAGAGRRRLGRLHGCQVGAGITTREARDWRRRTAGKKGADGATSAPPGELAGSPARLKRVFDDLRHLIQQLCEVVVFLLLLRLPCLRLSVSLPICLHLLLVHRHVVLPCVVWRS